MTSKILDNKKILITTLCFSILFCTDFSIGADASSLSLKSALEMALKNNREIAAAHHQLDSANEQLDAAKGKYLPSVNLEAKYTHLNDDIQIDLNDIRSAMISSAAVATQVASGNASTTRSTLEAQLPSFVTEVQKTDYYNASLLLTQPLFTGGKITANKNAKEQLRNSAITEKSNTEARVLAQIVQSYNQCQLAEGNKQVRIDALNGMRVHQKNAQNLLRAGQISKALKMKVDVSVLEAERELAKAEREADLAYSVLATQLNSKMNLKDLSTPLRLRPAQDLKQLKEAANQSPVLQQITYKKNLLEAKQTVARSEFLPTVAIFGKYELYKDDLTILEPEWAVGVGLKMNLFNGGADKNELNAVKKDQLMLNSLEQNAKDFVQIAIEKTYSDLKSAEDQYQSLIKTIDLAKESLRLSAEAFENGMAKNTDVLDAEVTLAAVKLASQKALFDHNNSLAQLYVITGQNNQLIEVFAD